MRRQNFTRRHWGPLRKKARLEHVRFHGLRHGAATLLLSLGAHPRVVRELFGDATIAVTMDTYSHVLGSMQRDVMDKVDEALEG